MVTGFRCGTRLVKNDTAPLHRPTIEAVTELLSFTIVCVIHHLSLTVCCTACVVYYIVVHLFVHHCLYIYMLTPIFPYTCHSHHVSRGVCSQQIIITLSPYHTHTHIHTHTYTHIHTHTHIHTYIHIYTVTSRSSFDNVKKWLEDIKSYAPDEDQLSLIILGNKSDIEDMRQVQPDEVKTLGDYESMEVSALSGQNIDAAFNVIVQSMKRKRMA